MKTMLVALSLMLMANISLADDGDQLTRDGLTCVAPEGFNFGQYDAFYNKRGMSKKATKFCTFPRYNPHAEDQPVCYTRGLSLGGPAEPIEVPCNAYVE